MPLREIWMFLSHLNPFHMDQKMWVKSGSNLDNTFHMRESTPDTVEPCYRPRVESGLKMADKGVMR